MEKIKFEVVAPQQVIEGVSKKTGKPYKMRKISGIVDLPEGRQIVSLFLPDGHPDVVKSGNYELSVGYGVNYSNELALRVMQLTILPKSAQ